MLFFCSIPRLQSHGDWKKNYPVGKASKIKKTRVDAKLRGRQQSRRAPGRLANEEPGDPAWLQGRRLGFPTPGGFQAAQGVGLGGGSWAGQNTARRCYTENHQFFLFFP